MPDKDLRAWVKDTYKIESDSLADAITNEILARRTDPKDEYTRDVKSKLPPRSLAEAQFLAPPEGVAPTTYPQERALVRAAKGVAPIVDNRGISEEAMRLFAQRPYARNLPQEKGPLSDASFPEAPPGSPQMPYWMKSAPRDYLPPEKVFVSKKLARSIPGK